MELLAEYINSLGTCSGSWTIGSRGSRALGRVYNDVALCCGGEDDGSPCALVVGISGAQLPSAGWGGAWDRQAVTQSGPTNGQWC